MKNNMKLWVVGMALTMAISVCAVYAADNSKPVAKPAKAAATANANAKVKLSQDDVTKIALNAHKDGKVTDIQLNKNVYIIKISSAQGNRILLIGGNTGKILKDSADKTQAANPVPAAKPAPVKSK